MKKNNKCALCYWDIRCHRHHIIPLKDYGVDETKNIITLCPNHHSEATLDEYNFAKKYKLKGKEISKKELNALHKCGSILLKFLNEKKINISEIRHFNNLKQKYKFSLMKIQSELIGVTEKSFINYTKIHQLK